MVAPSSATASSTATQRATSIKNGDRMGFLLDLDDGSLRCCKNGAEHGPGYPAGSVTGPVAKAVQMFWGGHAARRRQREREELAAFKANYAPMLSENEQA